MGTRFLFTAISITLVLFLAPASAGERPPNIVILFSDEMVIQLDVLPTILAAAGVAPEEDIPLDGVNLLPLLTGKTSQLDRDTLYWRYSPQFAIRKGDWKLVMHETGFPPELFNLTNDLGETTDLSEQEPNKFSELMALHKAWDATMQPPRWIDKRAGGLAARQKILDARKARKASQGKSKKRRTPR